MVEIILKNCSCEAVLTVEMQETQCVNSHTDWPTSYENHRIDTNNKPTILVEDTNSTAYRQNVSLALCFLCVKGHESKELIGGSYHDFLIPRKESMQKSRYILSLNLETCDTCSLCGLVVRVSGYRDRGLGFDSRRYQIF